MIIQNYYKIKPIKKYLIFTCNLFASMVTIVFLIIYVICSQLRLFKYEYSKHRYFYLCYRSNTVFKVLITYMYVNQYLASISIWKRQNIKRSLLIPK